VMSRNLLRKFFQVASGGERGHSEAAGHGVHDGERLAADRACRTEDGDFFQYCCLARWDAGFCLSFEKSKLLVAWPRFHQASG
jgi:hypothetical protein